MELMSGKSSNSIEEQVKIKKILDLFKKVNVNFEIAQKGGFIKRDYGFEFGDALIAASAKFLKTSIVTRNKKHFENIKGVKVIIPF